MNSFIKYLNDWFNLWYYIINWVFYVFYFKILSVSIDYWLNIRITNNYIIMWSCPGNMPKYYPGLRDILPDRRLTRSERHITRPKGRVICLSDLGNIFAYYLDKTTLLYNYLDKTTLISLLYWVSNCPGNKPKYYPGNMPKYHYRNLHEV